MCATATTTMVLNTNSLHFLISFKPLAEFVQYLEDLRSGPKPQYARELFQHCSNLFQSTLCDQNSSEIETESCSAFHYPGNSITHVSALVWFSKIVPNGSWMHQGWHVSGRQSFKMYKFRSVEIFCRTCVIAYFITIPHWLPICSLFDPLFDCLVELYSGLSGLQALQQLIMNDCTRLAGLPENFGELKAQQDPNRALQ